MDEELFQTNQVDFTSVVSSLILCLYRELAHTFTVIAHFIATEVAKVVVISSGLLVANATLG